MNKKIFMRILSKSLLALWVGIVGVTSVVAQSLSPSSDIKIQLRLEQVKKMLHAASQADAASLMDTKAEIEELPYPQRGDRKLARRLNASALEKLKAEQFQGAVQEFEAAWRADPSDQEISNNYGFALYKSNRYSEAEEKLRYTLALAPARATAWANLAEVMGTMGKPQQAADAFVVSHRFSRNPETTRSYIEKFAANAEAVGLKEGASRALTKLFPINAANTPPPALPVSSTEKKAMDASEQMLATGLIATVSGAKDRASKVPPALKNPMLALVSRLPDPQVGEMYRQAANGSIEQREALLRLANGGNLRAQNAVGNIYNYGHGAETNPELANSWYKKSAEGGFVLAQFAYAYNLYYGIGGLKNETVSAEYFRRSAEQGHPMGMNNFALMLERGTGLARPDRALAFEWYKKAADAGLARGAFNAGQFLQYSAVTADDISLAMSYYRAAANVGFSQAQVKVAQSYEYGWANTKDKAQAIEWYKKAALQGLEPAKDALKRLGVSDY